MYTISALWTHARQGLDVTTVIFSNRSYAILAMELERVGAGPAGTAGDAARSLLDLAHPALDFTALAAGMGVPAVRATTAAELAAGLRRALPSRARTSSRRSCPDRAGWGRWTWSGSWRGG